MYKNFYVYFIALFVLLMAEVSLACPCGCGAVNPQVLYPGEKGRVFTSLTRDANFKTVTYEGKLGDDAGPTAKNTFTFAYAHAFSNDLSATLTLPIEENMHPDESSNVGLSDPSLSARYVVLAQNFVEPLIPQIQAFATWKQSFSRSIYDSEKPRQMDVHGNGFHEFVPGLDFWFGMTELKAGLSQTLILPLKKDIDGPDGEVTLTPGWGQKTLVTAGYNYPGLWQVLGGIERETRKELKMANRSIADSDKIVNSALANLSYGLAGRQTLGLSYKRTAAFGDNKNTTRSDGVSVSFMQAF